jgi:anti-sigma regulatory factor (Ser/Thr protein kinase)
VLDEAVLLTSELCTNALQHTASGSGGTFTVTVIREISRARIEVRDNGAAQPQQPNCASSRPNAVGVWIS